MPDDEIQLIVEIELHGGTVPARAAEDLGAGAQEPEGIDQKRPEPGPDELIPELQEAEPNWEAREGETAVLPDGSPVTLESFGLGKVEPPVQLRAPPHTKDEKNLIEGMGDR